MLFFKKNQELLRFIWLSLSCKPGTTAFARLLKSGLDIPNGVYEADDGILEALFQKGSKILSSLKNKELGQAERILNYCEATSIKIITYGSEAYPKKLSEIDNPPVLLYCKGTLPFEEEKLSVGIVGTRSMTAYGKKYAFSIASALASTGSVIVSGMARGIDGVASAAAIYAKGKTVVVLGCGIDKVYPPEHRRLYMEIARNGAVLSEYPPGYVGDRYCFPVRNRLISALSDGLFVVEGDSISGALITAKAATKQGRTIFALPGAVNRVTSEAPQLLLKGGAHVADCADDILKALYIEYPHDEMVQLLQQKEPSVELIDSVLDYYGVYNERMSPLSRKSAPAADAFPASTTARYQRKRKETIKDRQAAPKTVVAQSKPLDERLRAVYEALQNDKALTIDDIQALVPHIQMREVISSLSKLSMQGLVKSTSSERYKRSSSEIE